MTEENNITNKGKYADLHCHPHLRSFNTFRQSKIERNRINFHPWHIIIGNKAKADEGKRATPYSQSDLVKLTNGNAHLAFVSLYPMEKGWFINNDLSWGDAWYNLWRWRKHRDKIWASIGALTRFNFNKSSMAQRILLPFFLKIPFKRARFYRSNNYDYFCELKKELNFLKTKNGITTQSLLYPQRKAKKIKPSPENNRFYHATGTYQIAQNGKHVNDLLNNNKTAFVLTIEGANILNTHLPFQTIKQNIDELKNDSDAPVFFITLAHHFYNQLCGHAHSLPNSAAFFINQTLGMHRGITLKGWTIIRELLSLNTQYKPDPSMGRRILIDVKHMNIVSRLQYYKQIILPNLNHEKAIPVIASHVCYSGVQEINTLIENIRLEGGKSTSKNFLNWNINLCDEEIVIIFASKGIIGLNFDQRVLGTPKKDNKQKDHFNYLWLNLKAMVDAVLKANIRQTNGRSTDEVWDIFCLGTDFDGYIDPANGYSTSLDFEKFEIQLIKELQKPENGYLLKHHSPQEIARKVVFENALNFVETHFH